MIFFSLQSGVRQREYHARQLSQKQQGEENLLRQLSDLQQNSERQLSEMNQREENLLRQLKEMKQQKESLQWQLSEMWQREENLQRQLSEMQQREENLQRQLSEMRQREENLQRQLIEMRQREENLQRQLKEMKQQKESLRRQLSEMQRREENLQRQLSGMQHREENLQRQLSEMRQREENLQRQLSEMWQREENLQRQLSEMQQREENLRRQLQEALQRDWVIARDEIQMTERCLGRGRWGSVVEGTYCGCPVAVKQIQDLVYSPDNFSLFEREMNIASKCRHPHLLQFIGATNDERSPLFVTELMEKSLRALLEQRPLSETEIAVISLDVARALNYLHQKKTEPINSWDVSSANVLLWRQGDQWRAKVSHYITANFMQQTLTVAPGATIYSAPEALAPNQTAKVSFLCI